MHVDFKVNSVELNSMYIGSKIPNDARIVIRSIQPGENTREIFETCVEKKEASDTYLQYLEKARQGEEEVVALLVTYSKNGENIRGFSILELYKEKKELELKWIFVDPKFRKIGRGKQSEGYGFALFFASYLLALKFKLSENMELDTFYVFKYEGTDLEGLIGKYFSFLPETGAGFKILDEAELEAIGSLSSEKILEFIG